MFKLPGPLDPSLSEKPIMDKRGKKKKLRGKGKRGGEVKDSANESDKESVPPFSYHPLLLHICSSPVPWGKGERESPRKEKGKKEKMGSVIPLYSKEGEREGGKTTEGQLKLMEIYNNLKLTSHCH